MSDEELNTIDEDIKVIVEGEEELPEEQEEEKKEEEKEEPPVTREELEKVSEANKATVESITQGIGNLADILSKPVPTPPQPLPAETEEEIQASDKRYFKEPTKTVRSEVEKLHLQKISPVLQQSFENSRSNARELAYVKEETKSVMEAYGEEVENLVDQLPPEQKYSSDVYKKTCLIVQSQHIEDIKKQVVEDAKKEWEEDMKKKNNSAYGGKTENTPPAPKRVEKKYTPKEMEFYKSVLDPEVIKYVTPEKDRKS